MKEKIRKILKYIFLLGIVCLVGILIYILTKEISNQMLEKNLKDIDWIREEVEITLSNQFGKNIYEVEKNDQIPIYNLYYQTVIDEKISTLLEKDYDIENPLMIVNPYGTNNLGFNIYFTTEEAMEISYTISVKNDQIPDFSRTLKNDSEENYTTEHQYQIIGLVAGEVNTIEITGITKDQEEVSTSITVDMTNVSVESDIILESTKGESTEELTEGLFVLFGLDKAFYANNYVYDNAGVLRADLVLSDYRSDRIVFAEDKMYYSYDTNAIAVVNSLGKIETTYQLDGYSMHHDYVLDEKNQKLLILVNSEEEEDTTIEDLIISLDLTTGKVEEIIDMKELLPEIYETAQMPSSGKNTYGGTGLDWIHLNSLSLVGEKNDIVVSGREISTIIYIKDIYDQPTVQYLIADEAVYQDTTYSDLLLTKVGDFVNQAGQHTITYVADETLEDGQYYLEMYNNNYGASNTREDFPWDQYPGVGTFQEGDTSKYYKYLVDENTNTYQLVEEFDVAYSSIVSSVQDVSENHVTSSGKSNCYAEYDKEGTLIQQYNYTSKKYAYRVFKYDFHSIWFSEK